MPPVPHHEDVEDDGRDEHDQRGADEVLRTRTSHAPTVAEEPLLIATVDQGRRARSDDGGSKGAIVSATSGTAPRGSVVTKQCTQAMAWKACDKGREEGARTSFPGHVSNTRGPPSGCGGGRVGCSSSSPRMVPDGGKTQSVSAGACFACAARTSDETFGSCCATCSLQSNHFCRSRERNLFLSRASPRAQAQVERREMGGDRWTRRRCRAPSCPG